MDRFPYKIDFTATELKLLNSLDEPTLLKLISIAKKVQADNLKKQNLLNLPNNTSNNSSQFPRQPISSPVQTAQTPHYNPSTGMYQNTPPQQGGLSGNSNAFGGNKNGSSLVNSLTGGANGNTGKYTSTSRGTEADADTGNDFGNNEPLPPMDPNFQIPENIILECRNNFGIDPGGSCPNVNSLTSLVKKTAMEACTIAKKRLISQSQYRSPNCNRRVGGAGASSHMSGMALDINVNNLTSVERQAVFMVFKQRGFNNIGCYRRGSGNVHLDHRPGGPRRWGSDYSNATFNAANCPPELIQVFRN